MIGKVLFVIMILFGAVTIYFLPNEKITLSIFLGILLFTFGSALSIYSKNKTFKFRWWLIILSSLSVISLILYRIILPEVWENYWKISESIFIIACTSMVLSFLIILLQVVLDKQSSFKVVADSVIIVIPVILFFWLEMFLAKDYIHRSKVDSIDELVYQVESNTNHINKLIGESSTNDAFHELYLLVEQANTELIVQSGGLNMFGVAMNAHNIRYADEIIVKSGLLSKIRNKIQEIVKMPNTAKYREELNTLIRYRIDSNANGNSVTEMRLRLRLIEQSIKIIEFEVKKADN